MYIMQRWGCTGLEHPFGSGSPSWYFHLSLSTPWGSSKLTSITDFNTAIIYEFIYHCCQCWWNVADLYKVWRGWVTHMCLCAALRALAASFIVCRTLVLVLADSRASRCISIVLSVPSICCSCLSYLFLRFRACRATGKTVGMLPQIINHLQGKTDCFSLALGLLGLADTKLVSAS